MINEGIYRSPKWLRNFLDYEISTGEDIKGEPSIKMKKKIEEEKIKADKIREEERIKANKIREEERIKEEERNKENFKTFLNYVISYIELNYKNCKITIPEYNKITIEKDNLSLRSYNKYEFAFNLTLDNNYKLPKFYVKINLFDPETYSNIFYFNYEINGIIYISFKNFILNTIYPWYKYVGQNTKKEKIPNNNKNNNDNKFEKDPIKNRQRRLELLKQTLKGYERTLNDTPVGSTRDQLLNEIEVIKGRIRIMEKPRNESYKHLMSFQLFEKQFNPIKDDYVMITYSLTGEPTPVRILKTYPNNTYLVSFDVEGSTAKGAPNITIRNSDIISPYKSIKSPVGSGFISANTNFQVRNTSNVNQVSNDMYL